MAPKGDDTRVSRSRIVPSAPLFLGRAAAWCIMALCAATVEPYDKSAQLLADDCVFYGSAQRAIARALAPWMNWDGVFYAHIAQFGYEQEKQRAFWPLLPLLLRTSGETLHSFAGRRLCPLLCIQIAGLALSLATWMLAVLALSRLTELTLGSTRLAGLAALFFAWAPATVFFSVLYTESLFFCLVLLGLLAQRRGQLWWRGVWLTLACMVRANGILLCIPVLLDSLSRGSRSAAIAAVFTCVAMAGPAVALQIAMVASYCGGSGRGSVSPYCDAPLLSSAYGSVQERYWSVGFLSSASRAQLPNWMLAAPAVIFSAAALRSKLPQSARALFLALAGSRHALSADEALQAAVYVQWAAMLAAGVLFMHPQVLTRFLATNPAFYWVAASIAARGSPAAGRALRLWLAAYFVLGCVLFAAFLPWT